LPNYPSVVNCMPHYTDEKNLRILRKFGIFNRDELTARTEIHLEKYSKTRRIEARTMIEMARRQLLPAALEYLDTLCKSIETKKSIGMTSKAEEKIAEKLNSLADDFYDSIERLEKIVADACAIEEIQKQAEFFHDYVLAEMNIMRSIADEIEINMPSRFYPIPTYSEIIYNV
nr:glutamine synthetase type III [Ruminococcus sp.]